MIAQNRNNGTRGEKVAKNMLFAIAAQAFMVIVNFVLRKVFLMILDETYLGLNGLFSDLLSMLSLAELGFGTSIVFSLYKPLAENDTEAVKSLMRYFRNVYRAVAAFVAGAGLLLTPWLQFFISEIPDIPGGLNYIRLVYIINVVNSASSYLFIYHASLLYADQKKYTELLITSVVKLAAAVLQIITLLLTRSYIAYIIIMVVSTVTQNAAVSIYARREYPYLKDKNVCKPDSGTRKTIAGNVRAMLLHKLGAVVIFSTDSIIISKFISLATVGIYSNYMLIRKALLSVIEPMFNAITAGFGNLNACENDEKKYAAFNNLLFFSAWLFGFCGISMFCIYNAFIEVWLGGDRLFDTKTVLLIVISFYLYCIRLPLGTARDACGLFRRDMWKPVFESVINIVLSVWWVKLFGISGVVLGTIASTVLVPLWVEPLVVYKYGLKKNPLRFFGRFFVYTAVTAGAGILTWLLCGLMPGGIVGILLRCCVCVIVPNCIFFVLSFRMPEFKYLLGFAKGYAGKLLSGMKRGGHDNE